MEYRKKDIKILGLSDHEERVLQNLSPIHSRTITKIAALAGLPRTTLYSLIHCLHERGFAQRVSVGQHTEWKRTSSEKIRKSLTRAILAFEVNHQGPEKELQVDSIDGKNLSIRVYQGEEALFQAYEEILTLSKTERVLAIQGNQSAERMLNKLGREYISEFQERFRRAHVIMESINGEQVLEMLKSLDPTEKESHRRRMLVETLLPDRFMNFNLDILLMRDRIFFVSLENELVFCIRNSEMSVFFRCLTDFLKDKGRRFNLSQYLQG